MRKRQSTDQIDNEFQKYVVQWLYGCLVSLILGTIAAWKIVPFVYRQRGYVSIGGEWLLVFAISLVAFQVCKWFFEKI